MKTRIIAFLLALIMLLSTALFTACTPPEPDNGDGGGNTDGGGNEGGDGGNEDTPDDPTMLPLTKGGKALFTVVYAAPASPTLQTAVNQFIKHFTDAGITVSKVGANETKKMQDCEILVGDGIVNRDDYIIDRHTVGTEGYAIKVTGDKLVVNGGCDRSTATALAHLADEVLKLTESGKDLNNLAISRATEIINKQEYPVKTIAIDGVNIDRHVIATDLESSGFNTVSTAIQSAIYNMSGFWLPIVALDEVAGDAIYVVATEDSGEGGFRIRCESASMFIECALPALISDTALPYVDRMFPEGNEEDLYFETGILYTDDILTVSYEDYGAVGDGVTDDFEAIKKTHDRANATGQTVVAAMGKQYYLGQHASTISIKTDTVWTGAVFIIDDSTVAPNSDVSKWNVFCIESDGVPYVLDRNITSLKAGQTNIGITLPEPMLLRIVNNTVKQYIRYGLNANSGSDMKEVILVDENGNVDPSTPILWDYNTVTGVDFYSTTDKPITITGGTVVTVANTAPSDYTYYNRGISIQRSNTVIKNMTHRITGEGDTGAPYNGFFNVSNCHNILIENCVLTGHKTYRQKDDERISMGSYEISCGNANKVTYKNVTQTNDINDTTYWGVMGTNFSKNLTYDGCKLSRFDAHQGVCNATIINSELGHMKIQAIGAGTLRIENTTVSGNTLVNLRNDYGSTWNGDVIIKNVHLKNTGAVTLIGGTWYNHYFGYTCHLPANVTVEGVTLDTWAEVRVFGSFNNNMIKETVNGAPNKNLVVMPTSVTVKGVNYTVVISTNTNLFKNVSFKKEN